MKKYFIMALAVMLLVNSCFAPAVAEVYKLNKKFSIRNDVKFHMKRGDVIQAETKYGTDMSRQKNATLHIIDDSVAGGYFTYSDIVEIRGVSFFREEAEYPTYKLNYYFNEDDQLVEVCYLDYGDNSLYKPEFANEDYSRTLKMLTEKYGEPTAVMINKNGALLNIHTFSHSSQTLSPAVFPSSIKQVGIKDCAQWVIQYKDCICLIELTLRQDDNTASKRGFVGPLMLAYRLFDHDEFQEVVNKASEAKQQATQDF